MPRNGIAGSFNNSTFYFLRKFHSFLQKLYQFIFLSIVYESYLFWTSSVTLVIFCLFDNNYSNNVRWYLIVILTCISLMINDREQFLCVFWPSVCLLWKISIQIICAALYLVAQSCPTVAHQAPLPMGILQARIL